MDANREALAFGGFHGGGVQTFLAWLAARVELKDGDQQPEPRVLDEDAIVLTTWHASKGREWPVVAVCGLDREVKASLPDSGSRLPLVRGPRATARGRTDRIRPGVCSARDRSAVSRGAGARGAHGSPAAAVRGAHARPRQAGARVAGIPRRQGQGHLLVDPGGGVRRGRSAKKHSPSGIEKFPCAVVAGGTELPEDA